MATVSFKEKAYDIDERGFLLDSNQWDEGFAAFMSSKLNIPGGLTDAHRDIIRYIRGSFLKYGACPTVYQTCKANGLKWRGLKQLVEKKMLLFQV